MPELDGLLQHKHTQHAPSATKINNQLDDCGRSRERRSTGGPSQQRELLGSFCGVCCFKQSSGIYKYVWHIFCFCVCVCSGKVWGKGSQPKCLPISFELSLTHLRGAQARGGSWGFFLGGGGWGWGGGVPAEDLAHLL